MFERTHVLERRPRVRGLLAILLLCVVSAGVAAEDGPRPMSLGERAAAEIAASYLADGPQAIASRLAASSPLRTLPPEEALKEIEVRAGPVAGAKWEMKTVVPSLSDKAVAFDIEYPSGVDETLTIELVKEGSDWNVQSLRSLAEPSPIEPVVFEDAAAPSETRKGGSMLPYAGAIAGACFAALAALLLRFRPVPARLIYLASAAIGVAAVVFVVRLQLAESAAKVVRDAKPAKPAILRLAELLPLRRAIVAGDASIPVAAQGEAGARDVARLWRVQVDLQSLRLGAVERALAGFPTPSRVPLVELLRGRAAFARFKDGEACRAYERAVNLGPGRDALWHEAAEALSTLGFEDRSQAYLERLPKIGSRSESAYYALAVQAAMANDDAAASAMLTRAWRLRPVAREQLVGSPALWHILRTSENLAGAISIAAVSEPAFRSVTARLAPIALPAGATSSISGEFLGIEIGDRFLGIPGGAALAPEETPLVDALAWSHHQQETAIADMPRIAELVHSPVALSQPAIRERLTRTTSALATRGRWDDIIKLTAGLSPSAENVPLDVILLRGAALSRTKQFDVARKLLGEVAASPAMARRTDPVAYYQLGELMASVELYEPAISMLEKAKPKLDDVSFGHRIRHCLRPQPPGTAYRIHKSKNFEIRFPEDVSPEGAERLGEVLELELERIRKIVPLAQFQPVQVNVLWWGEFRSTFTGSDHILGFYDGTITLPFAGILRLEPEIVAIASHELAHAVIAQATNDRAPSWLQEGLAQRIEMVPYHRNAFNMYEDDRLIAVSLLDTVLRDSVDGDLISEAYIESQTLVRYIEAAHGRNGLQKLINNIRDGASADEAIAQLSGKSTPEFDIAFRQWGRAAKTVFENPRPIDYTSNKDESIRFSKK